MYFLCLIDWGQVLGSKELKKVTDKIIGSPDRTSDGWKIKTLKWSELSDIISKVELGFYHSRLIFKFDLSSTPKTILDIREQRERLELKIEDYCSINVIPIIRSFSKNSKNPLIFTYPIFELNRQEEFWRFNGRRPYSLPTTCFFTKLDDPRRLRLFGKVKMRISGAKIIASDMSKWFFENLISIVFHEGLYRQTRDKKTGKLSSVEEVYNGLENRLEDFASRLMTTFHGYSSEYVRRNIQWIAFGAAALGIIIAFAGLILNLLRFFAT